MEINFCTTILIDIQNYFLLTGSMYGRHAWRPGIWYRERDIYIYQKFAQEALSSIWHAQDYFKYN